MNQELTNKIKNRVQKEADGALDRLGGTGALLLATGVGKTKCALNRIRKAIEGKELIDRYGWNKKVLIVVPTEKLRDEGWRDEFYKWDMRDEWEYEVVACCYASLHTYKNTQWDLVILDEAHNITEKSAEFFFENENSWKELVILTATKPTNPIKTEIFRKLKVPIAYQITLDEAVSLGLIAPYDVTIITIPLDKEDKYIQSGRKGSYFYQTELSKYSYLCNKIMDEEKSTPKDRITRMHFIRGLKSKTKAAVNILNNIIPQHLRTLIFCATKDQANKVCSYRYYSKPQKPKEPKGKVSQEVAQKYQQDVLDYQLAIGNYQGNNSFEMFNNLSINRLACVDALNEGHNITGFDVAFLIQLTGDSKDLIQRFGRLLRYRANFIGKTIILCSEGTVDVDWVKKALKGVNMSRIEWVTLEEVRTRKKIINFYEEEV